MGISTIERSEEETIPPDESGIADSFKAFISAINLPAPQRVAYFPMLKDAENEHDAVSTHSQRRQKFLTKVAQFADRRNITLYDDAWLDEVTRVVAASFDTGNVLVERIQMGVVASEDAYRDPAAVQEDQVVGYDYTIETTESLKEYLEATQPVIDWSA